MAEVLMKIIKEISDKQGLKGSMDLARITKMPSTKASLEPDSPQNVQMFKDAFKQLTGQYPHA